jgi:extradiol dioxygenase family protein
MSIQPFHIAFPVRDVEEAREFYTNILQCEEGRSDTNWVDLNLYGHQLVAHFKESDKESLAPDHSNPVDGHDVPVPHFGVVLKWDQWQDLATRLRDKNITFLIEPYIRFKGEAGEQATMFFLDPSGNALEFKAFKDPAQLFAK